MATFDDVTTPEPLGLGRYRVQVGADWAQGRALYGGLVAGLCVRAMALEAGGDRPLRSLLVQFVGPVQPGAVDVEVEVLRSGRSLTHVQARVTQDDRVQAVVVGGFGADRPSRIAVAAPDAPAHPEAGAVSMPYLPGLTPAFTQHFDYAWANGVLPFSGHAEPRLRGRIAHRNLSIFDVVALVGLADAPPPPVWVTLDRPFPGSSVAWELSILRPFAPGAYAPDAVFTYDARTTSGAHGYSDFQGSLWDAEGRCVAHSRQVFADFAAPD